jgi:hypothetical protein
VKSSVSEALIDARGLPGFSGVSERGSVPGTGNSVFQGLQPIFWSPVRGVGMEDLPGRVPLTTLYSGHRGSFFG